MHLGHLLATTAVATLLVPTIANAGEIEAVTLFSGGVAQVSRNIERVDGRFGLTVPTAHAGDVLKSGTFGPDAGNVSMRIGTQAPSSSANALPVSALSSLPELLASIRGTRVRLTSGLEVEGTVLGVDRRPGAKDGDPGVDVVSLLTQDGTVRTLDLRAASTLEILDADVARRLAASAEGLGAALDDTRRTIDVETTSDVGTLRVDYVVPAPVWKTTHRLALGEEGRGTLQTWAVVDNDSGEDWNGVELTLSTGSPVTIEQDLLSRHYAGRSVVAVTADRQDAAKADTGAVAEVFASADAMGAIAPAASQAMARRFDLAPATPDVSSTEGSVSASWQVSRPVDLADGSSVATPILQAEVPATRLALFDVRRHGSHPVATARLTNGTETTLPGGVVTVYDASGFVGDSTVGAVPPGGERILEFALDRRLVVTPSESPEERIEDLRISGGTLRWTSTSTRRMSYAIRNDGSEPVDFAVAMPFPEGWTIVDDGRNERTTTDLRLFGTVGPDETVDRRIALETPRGETMAVLDLDATSLARFSSGSLSDSTRDALRRIGDLKSELLGIRSRLDAELLKRSEAIADQERIRRNLASVGETPLSESYLSRLTETETEIDALDGRIADLRAEEEQLTDDLGKIASDD